MPLAMGPVSLSACPSLAGSCGLPFAEQASPARAWPEPVPVTLLSQGC